LSSKRNSSFSEFESKTLAASATEKEMIKQNTKEFTPFVVSTRRRYTFIGFLIDTCPYAWNFKILALL